MPPPPALVLVHGAFHRETTWEPLRRHLPDIDVRSVQLPSSAPVPVDELGDLFDDAAAIRATVDRVGGPVVVCAHSYGGAAASQALAGLDAVRHIVYLNAFVLDVGESMLGNRGGIHPPHWGVHADEGYIEMLGAEDAFYNDLTPAAAGVAAAELGPQSLVAMTQQLTRAAWHDVPSSYVIGDRDAGLPPAVQERYAARTGHTHRLDAGHSPFLSRPTAVAARLRETLAMAEA